jgi:hypothetical protein
LCRQAGDKATIFCETLSRTPNVHLAAPVLLRQPHTANAALPGDFTFFGLPGPPFPFFRLPRNEGMERREMPSHRMLSHTVAKTLKYLDFLAIRVA